MEERQHIHLPRSKLPAKIIRFNSKPGDLVSVGDKLLIFEYEEPVYDRSPLFNDYEDGDSNSSIINTNSNKREIIKYDKLRDYLYSLYTGKIESFDVNEGDFVKSVKKPIITIYQECGHGVQYDDMCALCGKDLSIENYKQTELLSTVYGADGLNGKQHIGNGLVNIMHDNTGIKVTRNEALRIEKKSKQNLLKSKKLSLIVDLDQTIIHAACDERISEFIKENKNEELVKDIHTFEIGNSMEKYHIKTRPGLDKFLTEISKLYELHIYTMGTRQYADKIASIIDPNKQFFQERVLSRDESGSITKKKLERLFPYNTSMVVIIDDRADVWEWPPNLIKVYPYEFFTGIGDINYQPMDQKLKIDDKNVNIDIENLIKNECDKEMLEIIKILKKIHDEYYSKSENDKNRDVKWILPKIKEKVLDGVHIAYSSIIPSNIDPSSTDIWQWAESFGAFCHFDVNKYTTHLICKPNTVTDKVKKALRIGISIVTLDWLLNSIRKWEKQNETEYLCDFDGQIDNEESDVNVTEAKNNTDLDGLYDKNVLNNHFDLADADKEVDEFLAESDNTTTDYEDETDDELNQTDSNRNKLTNANNSKSHKLVKKAAVNRFRKNEEELNNNGSMSDNEIIQKSNSKNKLKNTISENNGILSKLDSKSENEDDTDDDLSDLVREIEEGLLEQ